MTPAVYAGCTSHPHQISSLPQRSEASMHTEQEDAVLNGEQADVLDWIERHWDTLATVAWRGYVTAGRGLVVLDGAWDGAVAVGYLTAANAQATDAPWPATLI